MSEPRNEPTSEPRTRLVTCRCAEVDKAQAEGVYAYCGACDRASKYAGEPLRGDRGGPLAW